MTEHEQAFTIAILSSFTARGVEEAVRLACQESGLPYRTYLGGYNQYGQEILDPQSRLYAFEPLLVILFLDTRSILGDYYFHPYVMSDSDRRQWAENKIQEISSLVEAIKRYSSATVLLHNFEVPVYSPLGILEHKQPFGFKESIELLNAKLRESFKDDFRVFLFDYDAFCANIGKRHILDSKMYYLGDIKLHTRHLPELARAYTAYIKPMLRQTKKCVVLDLDNTVWGGILGEDGIEGITVGPTPGGRPFWEFQKSLLALYHRGVILAVNSKNNFDEVAKVFSQHSYMVLREQHFAAMRINWEDKVANMRSLAKEIGIGLDSMVFIDDDPVNRTMMKEYLPEVMVVDLPNDPSLYVKTLQELDVFNVLQLTEEDWERGLMYVQQRQRKAFEVSATDITEYLLGLQITVVIELATTMTIPRIAQLTQKTNQFNMTTRRYSEDEIRRFSQDGAHLIVSIKASDKFGEHGTIGAAIVETGRKSWRIDTFLLSCRVIGRRIEEALLVYIIEQARTSGVRTIVGEFIPTKKNSPAKDFYKKNGFVCTESVDSGQRWEYDVRVQSYPYPDCITVLTGETPTVWAQTTT
ncbi:HAD-IIIC family phosphatase [Candidatus Uhrbacteria bacterium]|nr:HAD-IIIC family phosphatase [Candidatus Uhrbacteria bacterium]